MSGNSASTTVSLEPSPFPEPGDPSTPAAAGQETPQVVTSLPETGAGGVVTIAAIVWAAIVMMLGLIGIGVRRGNR